MGIINNRTADHTLEMQYQDSTKHADNDGVKMIHFRQYYGYIRSELFVDRLKLSLHPMYSYNSSISR